MEELLRIIQTLNFHNLCRLVDKANKIHVQWADIKVQNLVHHLSQPDGRLLSRGLSLELQQSKFISLTR